MNDAHDNAADDRNILDKLAASNAEMADRFNSAIHPDLDGELRRTDELPEAILLAAGDLRGMMELNMLRAALRLLQASDLDESRIEEFVSWALHADPANPNIG